jgi:copper transport protein
MPMRSPGRNTVRWMCLLALVVLTLALPQAAQAHSVLVSSDPADGATVSGSPTKLRLEFSEDVQVAATVVDVQGGAPSGEQTSRVTLRGRPATAGETSSEVELPMPDLGRGRYLVHWSTISADDLHPTEGTFVFGVGLAVAPGASSSQSTAATLGSIAEAVLRWAVLIALGMALASVVISRRLGLPDPGDEVTATGTIWSPLSARSRFVGGAAGITLLLALLYAARIASAIGLLPALVIWQLNLRWAVALGACLAAWRRLSRPGAADRVSMLLLAVALVAITSTSHPAAAGPGWGVLGGMHTVFTMLWAGGVLVVATAVVPALRAGDRIRAVRVARAFTPVALACVPVSIVTGLLLSGRLLPSIGAVLHTGYGQALLVKLGLLALGLALAGGTVLLLVRGSGRRYSALVVGAEAAALTSVALGASALGAIHPASPVVWAPAPETAPTAGTLSQLVDDLVFTASLGPGQPGRNFVLVGVLDTRRPAPEPVSEVRVSVDGSAPVSAVPQGAGAWVAVQQLGSEGPTTIQVSADRPELPTATAEFQWEVGPLAGTHRGGLPLAPFTAAAAAALAVGCAGGVVVLWRRRTPRFAPASQADHLEQPDRH